MRVYVVSKDKQIRKLFFDYWDASEFANEIDCPASDIQSFDVH